MTHSNHVISFTLWWTQFAITERSHTSVNVSITDLEKQYFIMLSQIYMIVPIARLLCLAEKAKIFINSHKARWLPTEYAFE